MKSNARGESMHLAGECCFHYLAFRELLREALGSVRCPKMYSTFSRDVPSSDLRVFEIV